MKQTQDIFNQTIAFWSERTGQEFCQEDARVMVANVCGFVKVLIEWERRLKEENQEREEPFLCCADKGMEVPIMPPLV